MKPTPSPLRIGLLLAVGIAAISFSSILIRWSQAPVSVLGMYRLLLTDLLMLPFLFRPERRQAFRALSWRSAGLLVLSGLFLCLHFLFWMGSLRYTTVSSSTILMSLEPIFVLAGASVVFGERTTRGALLGMGIAIVGALGMGWGDFGVSAKAFFGDMLSLLGTVAVAVHMLLGQALAKHVPAAIYSFCVFLSAALFFLLFNGVQGYPLVHYPPREWLLFAMLAVIPTVFGHILFNWMLQFTNAATVSMSVLGEPVGASILAQLLLGERLGWKQAAADLVILAGVFLFIRRNKVTYAANEAPANEKDRLSPA